MCVYHCSLERRLLLYVQSRMQSDLAIRGIVCVCRDICDMRTFESVISYVKHVILFVGDEWTR